MIGKRGFSEDSGFAVRPMEHDDVDSVLLMLAEAFGPGFDHGWFDWKHKQGPWGLSLAWVAYDGSDLLGIRLFLPWRFRERDRVYRAFRPCDTVTVPEARGRGVFRALTEHAMSQLGDDVDFLFNTPNENSRPGYLKMGFVDWGQVRHRVALVMPRRMDLTDDPEPPTGTSRMRTDVDGRFLTWRYRDCPRRDYSLFGLTGDNGSGIVCRVRKWHGIRLIMVSELWGDSQQRVMLVKGAVHELGARAAWFAEPFPDVGFPSVARPGTVVTRYDVRANDLGPPALSLGDVEDVL